MKYPIDQRVPTAVQEYLVNEISGKLSRLFRVGVKNQTMKHN